MKRQAPLRMAWRLDALDKVVADLEKTRAMNIRTIGRAEIDRRSIASVDVMLRHVLAEVTRIRDGVREDIEEFENDDDQQEAAE